MDNTDDWTPPPPPVFQKAPTGVQKKSSRGWSQGHYEPRNPDKYVGHINKITYRSSWERKFMKWCDLNPSILKWSSETVKIPYFSKADNKQRVYHVDFIIKQLKADGTTQSLLIEIKPESQAVAPVSTRGKSKKSLLDQTYTYIVNQDKWQAAEAWAKKRGMAFVVMSEKQLGIKK